MQTTQRIVSVAKYATLNAQQRQPYLTKAVGFKNVFHKGEWHYIFITLSK